MQNEITHLKEENKKLYDHQKKLLNRLGKVEHEIETLNDKVSSMTASTIHVSPT